MLNRCVHGRLGSSSFDDDATADIGGPSLCSAVGTGLSRWASSCVHQLRSEATLERFCGRSHVDPDAPSSCPPSSWPPSNGVSGGDVDAIFAVWLNPLRSMVSEVSSSSETGIDQ